MKKDNWDTRTEVCEKCDNKAVTINPYRCADCYLAERKAEGRLHVRGGSINRGRYGTRRF